MVIIIIIIITLNNFIFFLLFWHGSCKTMGGGVFGAKLILTSVHLYTLIGTFPFLDFTSQKIKNLNFYFQLCFWSIFRYNSLHTKGHSPHIIECLCVPDYIYSHVFVCVYVCLVAYVCSYGRVNTPLAFLLWVILCRCCYYY